MLTVTDDAQGNTFVLPTLAYTAPPLGEDFGGCDTIRELDLCWLESIEL